MSFLYARFIIRNVIGKNIYKIMFIKGIRYVILRKQC